MGFHPAHFTYYYSPLGSSEPVYEEAHGFGSFTPTGVEGETIPDLVYYYRLVPQANTPLLVYFHGWDGGTGPISSNINTLGMGYLLEQGISFLGVAMRGRNTLGYGNDPNTVLTHRDASALEVYDIYRTIVHFINNVAPTGQINKNKIFSWGISGGGGNAWGVKGKLPGLMSLHVIWYAMVKYGTYVEDPLPLDNHWFDDNENYSGLINQAVGGSPLGVDPGATYYLSRDHLRTIKNDIAKVHMYHAPGDGVVLIHGADAAEDELSANSIPYVYYRSNIYNHGDADLLDANFNLSFGLQWVDDAKTLTRPAVANSGTLHVGGFVIAVGEDLEPEFEFWIHKYRRNTVTKNLQGQTYACTLNYNIENNTYECTPICPTGSDLFFFIRIVRGDVTYWSFIRSVDTLVLQPKNFAKKPANLNYTWLFFMDANDQVDGFVLDTSNRYAYFHDLSGNHALAWSRAVATRVAYTAGYITNGILNLRDVAGVLNTGSNSPIIAGELTIVVAFDPDAADIASYTASTGGLLGRGVGSSSALFWDNSGGKIQINFNTANNSILQNSTPNNTDLGKQVWVLRRDASNNVTATCRNGTSTYTYTLGTLSGDFEIRTIGSATATARQFSGNIYKIGLSNQRISDTDRDTILTAWYNEILTL